MTGQAVAHRRDRVNGAADALSPLPPEAPAIRAARRLNRAAGTVALSVLADSAIEHYRGSFENRAMYTPLITASLSLLASTHGTRDQRGASRIERDAIYALSGLVGLVGLGFHAWNITKREGGLSWLNLFYAAPFGAPAALSLSGLLGFASERLRDAKPGEEPRLLGLPAGHGDSVLDEVSMDTRMLRRTHGGPS
jgi:hypothetical protein